MRHKKISSRFSRTSSHRKAMFQNMANSIIEHELIKTTLPKAKTLRRYIEPLITIAGEDTVSKRRQVFDILRNKAAVAKLFTDIGPKNKSRPGGYLRVLKCGFRKGDCAPMAIVQLVESSQ